MTPRHAACPPGVYERSRSRDRKSTRLNSSHSQISYAVFSLKKKTSATPLTDYSGNTGTVGLWSNASKWDWHWVQSPAGSAVTYLSAPPTEDAVAVGQAATQL